MLASPLPPMDNHPVSAHSKSGRDGYPQMLSAEGSVTHFQRGAVVLVTLQSPREKFFGALLALAPFGMVFCGITLESIDDFITQIREGEPVRPSTLFFPMHRI